MNKMEIDSLIFARWIIPVEPAETVLEGHGIAIDNGRIIAIDTEQNLNDAYQAKQHHRFLLRSSWQESFSSRPS